MTVIDQSDLLRENSKGIHGNLLRILKGIKIDPDFKKPFRVQIYV